MTTDQINFKTAGVFIGTIELNPRGGLGGCGSHEFDPSQLIYIHFEITGYPCNLIGSLNRIFFSANEN